MSSVTLELDGSTPTGPTQELYELLPDLSWNSQGVPAPIVLPAPYGVSAFDPVRRKLVYVSGGWYGVAAATWELDIDTYTWSDVTPESSQPQWSGATDGPGMGALGSYATMCWDGVNSVVLLLISSVWNIPQLLQWDGEDWSEVSPTGDPLPQTDFPTLTWDPNREICWVFGVNSFVSDSCSIYNPFTGIHETMLWGKGGPSSIFGYGTAINPSNGRFMVLYGISRGDYSGWAPATNMIWEADEEGWQANYSGDPTPRGYVSTPYTSTEVYLIGGFDTNPFTPTAIWDSVWRYNGIDMWEELDPLLDTSYSWANLVSAL